MDYSCFWFGAYMLLLVVGRIQSLLVTDINVPQIVDFRDNVTLSCSYDISEHTLNSVKWYKNDMEFFRYYPLMQPIYMKFPVQGIHLIDDGNECNETSCRVLLHLLGTKSSGIYRCEVSGDAPHFKLSARTANMSVEALPQNDPLISSFGSMYQIVDFVQANCSTDYSSLQTKLTWYINGVEAFPSDLQHSSDTIAAHGYNLRRMVSQLSFYANEPRYHKPQLQQRQQQLQHQQQLQQTTKQQQRQRMQRQGLGLRCVAEIESYPKLRREASSQALLYRDEIDLKNQKLIKSVAATQSVALHGAVLLAALTTMAAAISTRLLTRLTFQYGVRKSTRYKIKMASTTATATKTTATTTKARQVLPLTASNVTSTPTTTTTMTKTRPRLRLRLRHCYQTGPR